VGAVYVSAQEGILTNGVKDEIEVLMGERRRVWTPLRLCGMSDLISFDNLCLPISGRIWVKKLNTQVANLSKRWLLTRKKYSFQIKCAYEHIISYV
jgi:hypothetical protein